MESFLFTSCGENKGEAISRIKKLQNILETHATSGTYDIIATIKTDNFTELKEILKNKIDKIVDVKSSLILVSNGNEQIALENFEDEKYTNCSYCGISLPHCHCRCPYCDERDGCECALFDAATGG